METQSPMRACPGWLRFFRNKAKASNMQSCIFGGIFHCPDRGWEAKPECVLVFSHLGIAGRPEDIALRDWVGTRSCHIQSTHRVQQKSRPWLWFILHQKNHPEQPGQAARPGRLQSDSTDCLKQVKSEAGPDSPPTLLLYHLTSFSPFQLPLHVPVIQKIYRPNRSPIHLSSPNISGFAPLMSEHPWPNALH